MNERFRKTSQDLIASSEGYLGWVRGLMETESATVVHLRALLAAKQATVDALLKGFALIDFPVIEGLAFDVAYQPVAAIEKLGGDWYDIFRLPDGRIAFSLGDVCGRGLDAAVKMAQAKQAIKVAACLYVKDSMPKAVLEQANKVIFLNDHHVELTTAIYGVIDLKMWTVTYASAGHHPPVLAKAGEETRVLPNHGFALGVESDMPDLIHEHQFPIESGSLLVLYSDGLIEGDHDLAAGEARLLSAARAAMTAKAIRPAQYIADNVCPAEAPQDDDVAVLTILFR